jgi:uncharacterized zinc-type alcohol dehydrogenase-like protein
LAALGLEFGRRSLSGTRTGGNRQTREMLGSCCPRNTAARAEVIPIRKVHEARGRMLRSDVRFRFRICMASLRLDPARGGRLACGALLESS